ncbi:hypothetical protein [Halorussus caseinilyticus]|uniref:Uncharacterized protein n=1 Tax=Halorussus caseinilyticus TaxID=3034025 RepID=A0ABD5WNE8_9EURY|nr:hypothetical protein [Halorussus sp. DT72]
MTARDEFGPDLDTAIPETFDVCPDCGTPTVKLGSHDCPADESLQDPTREERDRRIENDPYSDDETVLVRDRPRPWAYAYHERGDDRQTLCPAHQNSEFYECPRSKAKERGFSPCQFCRRIRDANSDDADRDRDGKSSDRDDDAESSDRERNDRDDDADRERGVVACE